MKILHVITTIDLGGAENHLHDLIAGQVRRGRQVSVAYLKGDHYWASRYRDLGVQAFCLDITSYVLLFKFYKLIGIIRSVRPDVIHAHMPPAELVTRLALMGSRQVPLVLSKHNDEPFAPVIQNRLLANWVARRASAIICISEAVRSYMSRWLESKGQSKLQLIRYAVDIEKYENAKPAVNVPWKDRQRGFVIGTVARLMPQKSLHTLLKGFALFQQQVPQAKLVIVGIGPLEAQLKQLAVELKIDSMVTWTGKRSNIPEIMKSFDVFALTSIYEGFGLVLLESLAAGVPIVASRVSAIPEVLDQGNCGLLFPAEDEAALNTCFQRLQSEELRRALIQKGRERVRSTFSIEKMVQETDQIYLRVQAN